MTRPLTEPGAHWSEEASLSAGSRDLPHLHPSSAITKSQTHIATSGSYQGPRTCISSVKIEASPHPASALWVSLYPPVQTSSEPTFCSAYLSVPAGHFHWPLRHSLACGFVTVYSWRGKCASVHLGASKMLCLLQIPCIKLSLATIHCLESTQGVADCSNRATCQSRYLTPYKELE